MWGLSRVVSYHLSQLWRIWALTPPPPNDGFQLLRDLLLRLRMRRRRHHAHADRGRRRVRARAEHGACEVSGLAIRQPKRLLLLNDIDAEALLESRVVARLKRVH